MNNPSSMMSQGLKLFKILYSGELKDIETESQDLLHYFSNVNIIAFYIHQKKRLYIWVGDDVSRALRNYIPNMRQIFSREYPSLRVLRYITVESMEEPFEFLRDIKISKQEIHNKLKSKREEYKKHEDLISQINEFKREADDYFENNNFIQAIKSAEKVINLASKINDEVLIDDQENLIEEAKARLRAESTLNEIREQKKVLNEKLHSLEYNKKREKIVELHNYIEQFKSKYNEYLDLSALENVKELVGKAEEIWENYKAKVQEEKIHKDLLNKVDNLRERGMTALNKGSLKESFSHFEKIISIIGEIENE